MKEEQGDEQEDAVDAILGDWKRSRPELDTTTIGVFGRLSRISTLQRAIHDARFQRHGLTLGSFDVLANLRRSAEPTGKTAGDLAKSSMLTTGGITFRLDRMEDQNLIERMRTREDRRLVYAKLTDHGKQLIDTAIEDHLKTQRTMLSALSDEEIGQLTTLLKKVEKSISNFEPAPSESAPPTE